MKRILLALVSCACSLFAGAQVTDQTSATLQNGDQTSVFYGFAAFKEALAAAPDAGAIITLSPGAFENPGDIQKNVKIYGAGFEDDTINHIARTRINGDISLKSSDEVDLTAVRIEGLYINGHLLFSNDAKTIANTEIVKCSFENFYHQAPSSNTIIRQCYLRSSVFGENRKATAFVLPNCWIGYRLDGFASGSEVLVDHCILDMTYYYYAFGPYFYKNNIVRKDEGAGFSNGATCYNNVGTKSRLIDNTNISSIGNYGESEWISWASLLKDGQNDLKYNLADGNTRTWELNEPTRFVGTDGTPCGVTGGDYPWNPIPSTPRIISTSVDSKATPGKLKVNIKAEARPLD